VALEVDAFLLELARRQLEHASAAWTRARLCNHELGERLEEHVCRADRMSELLAEAVKLVGEGEEEGGEAGRSQGKGGGHRAPTVSIESVVQNARSHGALFLLSLLSASGGSDSQEDCQSVEGRSAEGESAGVGWGAARKSKRREGKGEVLIQCMQLKVGCETLAVRIGRRARGEKEMLTALGLVDRARRAALKNVTPSSVDPSSAGIAGARGDEGSGGGGYLSREFVTVVEEARRALDAAQLEFVAAGAPTAICSALLTHLDLVRLEQDYIKRALPPPPHPPAPSDTEFESARDVFLQSLRDKILSASMLCLGRRERGDRVDAAGEVGVTGGAGVAAAAAAGSGDHATGATDPEREDAISMFERDEVPEGSRVHLKWFRAQVSFMTGSVETVREDEHTRRARNLLARAR